MSEVVHLYAPEQSHSKYDLFVQDERQEISGGSIVIRPSTQSQLMGIGWSGDCGSGSPVEDRHPDLGSDLRVCQHADRMVGLLTFEAHGLLPES